MARNKGNWTVTELVLVIVFGLFLIVISPILIPLLVFAYLKSKLEDARLRRFLKSNEGAKYFCYTSKSTGLEFARKNILPHLDVDVQIIYMSEKGRMNLGDDLFIHTLIGMKAGGAKRGGYPCVAKVVDGQLISESLNTEFYRAIVRNASAHPLLLRINDFYSHSS